MDEFKVVFVRMARDDLGSIVRFVAQRANPAVAERLGLQLIEKALTLRTLPERGRIVPELKNPAVREIFFNTFVSFIEFEAVPSRWFGSGMLRVERLKSIATSFPPSEAREII